MTVMKTQQAREDITLANGRIVTHSRMANGAQQADMADGGNMSEAEWEEYCGILQKRTAAFIERMQEQRRLANHAAMSEQARDFFALVRLGDRNAGKADV